MIVTIASAGERRRRAAHNRKRPFRAGDTTYA
jgi:hypothetical protein